MDAVTQEVLDRQKFVWALGNYERAAEILRPAAQELVRATGVKEGTSFLDVGAGTGNVAVEAAQAGARVIATDLTPHLIEIGKRRTAADGLNVEWQEADAQNLPFEDRSFDVVGSAFGAMFAPNADAAVREMLRVTKPGGVVALTSWASDGYTGETLAATMKYMPPAPEGVNTAAEWGDEEEARSRFARHSDDVEIRRGVVTWEFESPDEAARFWREDAPPGVAAQMVLSPEKYEAMQEETAAIQGRHNRGSGGRVALDSDYLLVLARRTT